MRRARLEEARRKYADWKKISYRFESEKKNRLAAYRTKEKAEKLKKEISKLISGNDSK